MICACGKSDRIHQCKGAFVAVKKIECIIKPHILEPLQSDLLAANVSGRTVYEVRGFGRQKGHSELYKGSEYLADLLPKLKVEIYADDGDVERIVNIIAKTARSGKIGDGKIVVTPIEHIVRIRTGETGPDAI